MPDEAQGNLAITERNNVTVVEFQDRKILEEILITQLGEQLDQLIGSQFRVQLLLTFKNVEHLSSAALGMLITLHNKVKETQGRLMLSDINPQIYQVFEITKLDRLFEIHPTAQQALGQA